jgi:hypothetical protein
MILQSPTDDLLQETLSPVEALTYLRARRNAQVNTDSHLLAMLEVWLVESPSRANGAVGLIAPDPLCRVPHVS